MKVGVLSQDEEYWSLNALSSAIVDLLGQKSAIRHYHWRRRERYEPNRIRQTFRGSEVVVSIGSRAIRCDRECATPAVFLAHAWLDHAAGINLMANERCFRQDDTLTFASRPALEKYRLMYPDGPRGMVLPYFVPGLRSSARDSVGANGRPDLAKRYGLAIDQKWVLAAGRLSAEKNTAGLVRMWQRLARSDATLVIAGSLTTATTAGRPPGDDFRQTTAAIEAVATGRVPGARFVGPLDRGDLAVLMRQSHVLAHPTLSYEEDFGLVAAEAMAAALPVVCTDWGGLKDIVVHGETGFKARTWLDGARPWLDEDAYCAWLTAVLDDEDLRDRLAIGAAHRADAEYVESVFAGRLWSIARETYSVATGGPNPARLQPIPAVRKALRDAVAGAGLGSLYADGDLFGLLYQPYATGEPALSPPQPTRIE